MISCTVTAWNVKMDVSSSLPMIQSCFEYETWGAFLPLCRYFLETLFPYMKMDKEISMKEWCNNKNNINSSSNNKCSHNKLHLSFDTHTNKIQSVDLFFYYIAGVS